MTCTPAFLLTLCYSVVPDLSCTSSSLRDIALGALCLPGPHLPTAFLIPVSLPALLLSFPTQSPYVDSFSWPLWIFSGFSVYTVKRGSEVDMMVKFLFLFYFKPDGFYFILFCHFTVLN